MEARAKIEEDLFTRVPLSKTERRRAKATTRSMNSLQNVGDFGDDVADLVEVAEELEGQRGKRQRLVDSVTLASGSEARKNQKPVSGEQDVPLRDSLGVRVPLFLPPGAIFDVVAVFFGPCILGGYASRFFCRPARYSARRPLRYFILFSFCFPGPRFYYFRVVRLHLDSNLHVRRPSVCFEGVACEP